MADGSEADGSLPGSIASRRVPGQEANAIEAIDFGGAARGGPGRTAAGLLVTATESEDGDAVPALSGTYSRKMTADISAFLSARLNPDLVDVDDATATASGPAGGSGHESGAGSLPGSAGVLPGHAGDLPRVVSGRDFASGKLDLTVPHTEPPRFGSMPKMKVPLYPSTPKAHGAGGGFEAGGLMKPASAGDAALPVDEHGRPVAPAMTVNRSISEGPDAQHGGGGGIGASTKVAVGTPAAQRASGTPAHGASADAAKKGSGGAGMLGSARRGSGGGLQRFGTRFTASMMSGRSPDEEPMTLAEAADGNDGDDTPSLALVEPGKGRALRRRADNCVTRMRQSPTAKAIRKVVGHPAWVTLVLATSVWAICADDFRILWGSAADNDAWLASLWATVAFFGSELIVYSVLVEGYAFSFFFWLDLVATIAIMPVTGGPDSLSLARVARASRALRVVRVMRATRLASVVGAGLGRGFSTWYEHHSRARASIMGRSLVYHTHISITMGTVALLLGSALLAGDTPVAQTARHGLCMMHLAAPALGVPALGAAGVGANWTQMVDGYRQAVEGFRRVPLGGRDAEVAGNNNAVLVRLSVRGVLIQDWSAGALDLRTDNPVEVIAFACGGEPLEGSEWPRDAAPAPSPLVSVAHVSVRDSVLAEAEANLWSSAYILLILSLWMLGFSYDFSRLVVIPLERMISFLKVMMDDPLRPMDLDARRLAEIHKVQSYEMEVVEISLAKISRLLQLGFGDAGARIIARNLVLGEVDPMAPGHKVLAVMGFCDIRSFTDMTEVLREQVLEFTNTVAEIVGTAVHNRGGGVNKNIGDAFFAVWRVRDRDSDDPISRADEGWGKGLEADKDVGRECDAALQAFLVSNRQVLETEAVQAYGRHPGIQARLPGYEVRLGFGLHVGWAIEGAVGNRFKIDATYLSPHVNLTSRLESLTKSYGVTFLMSGQFTQRLSAGVRVYVRPVDRVTVKGSAVPVLLETWDQETASDMRPIAESGEFLRKWNLAFCAYLEGRWGQARDHVNACLAERPADKQAPLLLEFMGRTDFVAPSDWEGYRVLVEK